MMLFGGCINDDELNFPDDQADVITQSLAIKELLNYEEVGKDSSCFEIVYPIKLAYNNGTIISINELSGLLKAVESQSNLFFIDGVVLPILINKAGTLSNIATENELKALLSACEIPGLKDFLAEFETQCFELVYPFTILNEGTEFVIENKVAYDKFKKDQGAGFYPQFGYPITIERYQSNQQISVESDFELLEIINTCLRCPVADIGINPEFDGTYSFTANYKDVDQAVSYKWYLNNDFLSEGEADISEPLNLALVEGQYEICLKSFNPDCQSGDFTCRSFFVNKPCPELSFIQEQSTMNSKVYQFKADFELKNDISYGWVVYKNNDFVIFEEEIPGEGDNIFNYEFSVGSYVICIEKESFTQECPLAKYCIELVFD